MQENNPFLYPGQGSRLKSTTGASAVPDTGRSEVFSLGDCTDFGFDIILSAPGAGTVDVYKQIRDAAGALVAETLFASIDLSGIQTTTWFNGNPGLGRWWQLHNITGASAEIALQKRIN